MQESSVPAVLHAFRGTPVPRFIHVRSSSVLADIRMNFCGAAPCR